MPRLTLTWTQEQINAAKGKAYALGLTVSEYLWQCFEKAEGESKEGVPQ